MVFLPVVRRRDGIDRFSGDNGHRLATISASLIESSRVSTGRQGLLILSLKTRQRISSLGSSLVGRNDGPLARPWRSFEIYFSCHHRLAIFSRRLLPPLRPIHVFLSIFPFRKTDKVESKFKETARFSTMSLRRSVTGGVGGRKQNGRRLKIGDRGCRRMDEAKIAASGSSCHCTLELEPQC